MNDIFLRTIFVSWEEIRSYAIAKLPSLKRYDGKEVRASERIYAVQRLPQLEDELRRKVLEIPPRADRVDCDENSEALRPAIGTSSSRDTKQKMVKSPALVGRFGQLHNRYLL